MKNITLVIMAAGIGSRFGGGIKQLEPVGPNGECHALLLAAGKLVRLSVL